MKMISTTAETFKIRALLNDPEFADLLKGMLPKDISDRNSFKLKRDIAKIIRNVAEQGGRSPRKIIRFKGTNGQDTVDGTRKNDILRGRRGRDTMQGLGGSDIVEGAKGNDDLDGDSPYTKSDFNKRGYFTGKARRNRGNDIVRGGDGNDTVKDGLGKDILRGGKGNDRIVSIADSGVPKENPAIPANTDDGNDLDKLKFTKEFYNPMNLNANDKLVGGDGSDTFEFRVLLNASKKIVDKHTNADGSINWGMNGVAGENNNYHDHWVDGIGRDTILDFSGTGGEGDKVLITGHTVTFKVIGETDNMVRLGVYSDQGDDGARGGGAHDLDVLGIVNVRHDGNFNLNKDVSVVREDFGAY